MPISPKQLEANRRNARLSTGPRTPEGKARAAYNGFKSPFTGLTTIMSEEDRIAQLEFVTAYVAELAPQGLVELNLARTIALDSFRINRIKTVEENIFAWGYEIGPGRSVEGEVPQVENAYSHVIGYLKHCGAVDKISLYEARLSRTVSRNFDRLMKLQAQRLERQASEPVAEIKTRAAGAAAIAPESAHEAAAQPENSERNQQVTRGNGFVRPLYSPSGPAPARASKNGPLAA